MPQELYAATVAPDSDGTERLWLGDAGSPYYLTLNRLFYKNAAGNMFTALPVNIDNGTGGTLIFGDSAASGLTIAVTDGSGADLTCATGVAFAVQADTGSLKNSGASVTHFSWGSTGAEATFRNADGLRIWDTNQSHSLRVAVGSNLTANRTFTLTTGNADRTLDISAGSVTISAFGATVTAAADAAAARTLFGTGTADSPEFTAVNIGHASDTTISRLSAGDVAVEGNRIFRAGGTDVPVADGGTGASTAAGARTNLELVIGTHVQAWDADLDAVASSGIASAWTSYTPTVAAGVGSFTSVAAAGAYKQIGKTVFVRIRVTVTTKGTAASYWTVTAPVNSINAGAGWSQMIFGACTTGTGQSVRGQLDNNSNLIYVVDYNNSFIGESGYVINLTGCYEAA